MKIAVWDTYVTRKDGKVMHFDILVDENQKDENQIFEYGKTYLKSVMQEGQNLTSKECNFCHIDKAPDEVEQQILNSGFSIIEMENCY
jgi:nitrate/TMAO reductase-like tetraheme cytochrome c subunit